MSQNEGIGIGNTLGLPFPAEPPGDRFPSISFSRTSVDRLRPANPRVTRVTDFHFSEAITYVHGNHIIKTGGAFKRVHDAYAFRGTHTNGTYTFSGQFTGDGFADFLLGIPATMILPITPNPQAFYTQTGFSVYLADDWRVSPRLTVSLGLRYEFESFPAGSVGFHPEVRRRAGRSPLSRPEHDSRAVLHEPTARSALGFPGPGDGHVPGQEQLRSPNRICVPTVRQYFDRDSRRLRVVLQPHGNHQSDEQRHLGSTFHHVGNVPVRGRRADSELRGSQRPVRGGDRFPATIDVRVSRHSLAGPFSQRLYTAVEPEHQPGV